MEKFVYVQGPGVLWDTLFLLELYFNGEEAFHGSPPEYAQKEHRQFAEMRMQVRSVSEKLLPYFYLGAQPQAPLTAYANAHWQSFSEGEAGVFVSFLEFLRDGARLKAFLFRQYFPNIRGRDPAELGADALQEAVMRSALPEVLKLYLLDIFLSGEEETRFLCTQRAQDGMTPPSVKCSFSPSAARCRST